MTTTQIARPALRFLSADTTTGIVAYAVASQHDASRTNIISMDTTNGATFCTCRASECNHGCWHEAAIVAAWDAEQARQEVVWLTDAQLVRYGTKAAHMVNTYTARIGRSRLADRVALLVARGEYRRRRALGLIEMPVAVALAA